MLILSREASKQLALLVVTGDDMLKLAFLVQATKALAVPSERGYSNFVCSCLWTQFTMELNTAWAFTSGIKYLCKNLGYKRVECLLEGVIFSGTCGTWKGLDFGARSVEIYSIIWKIWATKLESTFMFSKYCQLSKLCSSKINGVIHLFLSKASPTFIAHCITCVATCSTPSR